jgi:hypothetical protein
VVNKARDFTAKFLTDTSKFDTAEPVRELDALADAADTTARRMDSSFDRVRDSSKRNLDHVADDAHPRAAAAGQEIGAELNENIGEALRSGDIGAFLTDSLTSLAPALGAIGVGVGLGAAFVGGVIKDIQHQQQALQRATQAVFDNLTLDFTSLFVKFDEAAFANQKFLELGGDDKDPVKASKRLQELARNGIGKDTIFHLLIGKPTADDIAKMNQLQATTAERIRLQTGHGETITAQRADEIAQVEELNDLMGVNVRAHEEAANAMKDQVDQQRSLNEYVRVGNRLLTVRSRDALARGGFTGKALPTDDI